MPRDATRATGGFRVRPAADGGGYQGRRPVRRGVISASRPDTAATEMGAPPRVPGGRSTPPHTTQESDGMTCEVYLLNPRARVLYAHNMTAALVTGSFVSWSRPWAPSTRSTPSTGIRRACI